MEILLPSLVAFVAAVLTFFSGFGLGTLLTPVLALFFPIELAVALTGVVHFFNNIFKLFLVGKNARWPVLLRFGLPAVLAALLGAWLLLNLAELPFLFTYQWLDKTFVVRPVAFLIGLLLGIFALLELLPYFDRFQFGPKWLPLGGFLSGFFGGLSGHQGALRSAFLIRAGLTKEAFIGTAVVISAGIDFSRLSVYATRFADASLGEYLPLVLSASAAAIAGAYLGNYLLKKVTLIFVQRFVAAMLLLISLALMAGWIS